MKEVTRKMLLDTAMFAASQVAFYYAFKVSEAIAMLLTAKSQD